MAEVSNTSSILCVGGSAVSVSLDMKAADCLYGDRMPPDEVFPGGKSILHADGYCVRDVAEAENLRDACPKLLRSRSKPQNVGDLVIPAQKLDDPSDGPEVRDADNFEGERGPRR